MLTSWDWGRKSIGNCVMECHMRILEACSVFNEDIH